MKNKNYFFVTPLEGNLGFTKNKVYRVVISSIEGLCLAIDDFGLIYHRPIRVFRKLPNTKAVRLLYDYEK
jgi:hypothetical protein